MCTNRYRRTQNVEYAAGHLMTEVPKLVSIFLLLLLLLLLLLPRSLTVRLKIIGSKTIKNVGKSESCMVSKVPIGFKRTRTLYMYDDGGGDGGWW